jgi:putative membrane protein
MKARRRDVMSSQQKGNRGTPWIYGAFAIGGTVAVLAAIIILASLLRPTLLSGASFYPWFHFFPFFPFVAFLIVIFFVKWSLWGWGWRSGDWRYYSDARRILEERYARGELTREQLEQMRNDLER